LASGGKSAAPLANAICPTRPSTGWPAAGNPATCDDGGVAGAREAAAAGGDGDARGALAAGAGCGGSAAAAAGGGGGDIAVVTAGGGDIGVVTAGGAGGGSGAAATAGGAVGCGGAVDNVGDAVLGAAVRGGVRGAGAAGGSAGAGVGAVATAGGVRIAGGGGGGAVTAGTGAAPVSAPEAERGVVGGLSAKTGGAGGGLKAGAEPFDASAVAGGFGVVRGRAGVVEAVRGGAFGVSVRAGGGVRTGACSCAAGSAWGAGAASACCGCGSASDWICGCARVAFAVCVRLLLLCDVAVRLCVDEAGGVRDAAVGRDVRCFAPGCVTAGRRDVDGLRPSSSSTDQSTSTLGRGWRSCSWAAALPAQAIKARPIAQVTPRILGIPIPRARIRNIEPDLPINKKSILPARIGTTELGAIMVGPIVESISRFAPLGTARSTQKLA